jgi:hypothetical protein
MILDRISLFRDRITPMPRRAPVFIILVALLAACGGSVTQRAERSVSTALTATNAARDYFVAWDERHQLAIVDASVTQIEAETRLAEYRAKRDKVLEAFVTAYTAISAAAAALPLVEAGEMRDGDLMQLLADALVAVTELKSAVDAIRRLLP